MKPAQTPVLLGIALGIYALWTSLGWDHYPRVWVDEGWIAEVAWTHAHQGILGTPAHGEIHRYADRVYWMPPLYFLLISSVIHWGVEPLAAGRAVSWLGGLAGLVVLWMLGRSLLGRPSGDSSQSASGTDRVPWWLLWVVLLYITDPMLWKVHRSIRFESWTGLGILAAVGSAVWAGGVRGGIGSGLAAAGAALTHPAGGLALPAALGVLWWMPGRSRRQRTTGTVAMVATMLLLALPYLAYLGGDRASGFANVLGQNAPHLSGASAAFPASWLSEWTRYRAYFAWPRLAVPLGLWLVTLVLAVRGGAPRWLGWVLAVLLGGLAALPNKTELYLTLVAPFLYLLAAWVGSRARPRMAARLAAGLWLLCLVGADAVLLRRDRACDYRAWVEPVTTGIDSGASLAGTYVTWFPAREHPYLEFHRQRAGDVARARPEYVLWGGEHLEDPLFTRLRDELGPFLAAHADTVAVSASPCYGTLRLLRPRWSELDPAALSTWERYGEGEPVS